MSRILLKKRVFNPTGNIVGSFDAIDLEPVDLVYKDDNSIQVGKSGGGDTKKVPDPIDNNPLKRIYDYTKSSPNEFKPHDNEPPRTDNPNQGDMQRQIGNSSNSGSGSGGSGDNPNDNNETQKANKPLPTDVSNNQSDNGNNSQGNSNSGTGNNSNSVGNNNNNSSSTGNDSSVGNTGNSADSNNNPSDSNNVGNNSNQSNTGNSSSNASTGDSNNSSNGNGDSNSDNVGDNSNSDYNGNSQTGSENGQNGTTLNQDGNTSDENNNNGTSSNGVNSNISNNTNVINGNGTTGNSGTDDSNGNNQTTGDNNNQDGNNGNNDNNGNVGNTGNNQNTDGSNDSNTGNTGNNSNRNNVGNDNTGNTDNNNSSNNGDGNDNNNNNVNNNNGNGNNNNKQGIYGDNPKSAKDRINNSNGLGKLISGLNGHKTDIERTLEKEEREDNIKSLEKKKNSTPMDKDAEKNLLKKTLRGVAKGSDNPSSANGNKGVSEDTPDKKGAGTGNGGTLGSELLGNLGAGSLVSAFKNSSLENDWRKRLNRLLDKALGTDIIYNPNLINKRVKDAPPGREDFIPKFKTMAILMDCSSSMGYEAFKRVIDYLSAMFKAKNLSNVDFWISLFGDVNLLEQALDLTKKVKGKNVTTYLREHSASAGGTNIYWNLLALTRKCRRPELLIILTDGEIYDAKNVARNPTLESYIKRNRKKIIWIFPRLSDMTSSRSYINKIDPHCIADKRYITFK